MLLANPVIILVILASSCWKKNQAYAGYMSANYGELHYSGNFEFVHTSSSGNFLKIKAKPSGGGKFCSFLG